MNKFDEFLRERQYLRFHEAGRVPEGTQEAGAPVDTLATSRVHLQASGHD